MIYVHRGAGGAELDVHNYRNIVRRLVWHEPLVRFATLFTWGETKANASRAAHRLGWRSDHTLAR